jgi:hypothetical protein
MLTIFWDVNSSILVHFQERGQNVTSARYNNMLVNKLKTAIRSERKELISKRVLLPHDKPAPNTVAHTMDTLCALNFEVLKQPP